MSVPRKPLNWKGHVRPVVKLKEHQAAQGDAALRVSVHFKYRISIREGSGTDSSPGCSKHLLPNELNLRQLLSLCDKSCLGIHHTLSGGGGGWGVGGGGVGGGCLRSFPEAHRLLPQIHPATFRVAGRWGGMFAFVSQAHGKHNPLKSARSALYSCQPNGKHTRSSAPAQHCIHAWEW